MIIKTLMDNIPLDDSFKSEHGFSLYIETGTHKILFDAGASDLFLQNAQQMLVDLSQVDFAVISHGHYDHGGGLSAFLELNQHAPVYMRHKAFGVYYTRGLAEGEKKYIGLPKGLLPNPRFILLNDNMSIDEFLMIYGDVKRNNFSLPEQNLFKREADQYYPDDFAHEQYLLIREKERLVLFTGCAHRNIINILDDFYARQGCWPTDVIGGFHLMNLAERDFASSLALEKIGEFLLKTTSRFHTNHCTGIVAYQLLKQKLQNRLTYLSAGSSMELL